MRGLTTPWAPCEVRFIDPPKTVRHPSNHSFTLFSSGSLLRTSGSRTSRFFGIQSVYRKELSGARAMQLLMYSIAFLSATVASYAMVTKAPGCAKTLCRLSNARVIAINLVTVKYRLTVDGLLTCWQGAASCGFVLVAVVPRSQTSPPTSTPILAFG